MKSVRTKQCEVVVIITTILHIILLVGPFVYFVPFSLGVGAKVEQIALSMSSLVSVILVLVSIIIDTTRRAGLHRTALWLITAGIITCLGELSLVFIWIMAGIAILDELVVLPIRRHYSLILTTNKEIDAREAGNIRDKDQTAS